MGGKVELDDELIYYEDTVEKYKKIKMKASIERKKCPLKIIFISKKEREDAKNIDNLTIK